jgi:hypothetical protein
MRIDPTAARAVAVSGGAELPAELFPESFSFPRPSSLLAILLARSKAWLSAASSPTRMITSSWKGQTIVARVVSSA